MGAPRRDARPRGQHALTTPTLLRMPDTATAAPSHPYDRPTDPAKRHSTALTDGPDRAGARAMLKAIGFTDDDLAKPLVGVATTWIETMPCNFNQRRLAEFVKGGIRAAGGTPMEFNTVSVSDGVSMGTEGMKASLDQPRGHRRLDRAGRPWPSARRRGLPRRLRQDDPGAAMALGRLDVPGLVLYNGTIYPGVYKGQRTPRWSRSSRRSGRIGQARSPSTSCTRSRTSPARARGRAAASSRPTRCDGAGVPRALAGRPQRHPRRGPGQGRGRPPAANS